jgi:hypothetical protein
MTTNHHTPLSTGDPRNAAQINARLGDLDEAISDNATDIAAQAATLAALSPSFLMRGLFQARLSVDASDPLPTADDDNDTIRLIPFRGNVVGLYNPDAGNWEPVEISTPPALSLSGLAINTNYDVFAEESSGLAVLSGIAWANSLSRDVPLVAHEGVYVQSGAPQRRYAGTIRVHSDGNAHDTELRRFVWNYYNRARRSLHVHETAASWTYAVANTWRPANNNTANRVEFVTGVQEDAIAVWVEALNSIGGSGSATWVAQSAGLDITNGVSLQAYGGRIWTTNVLINHRSTGVLTPAQGYHFLQWVERQDTTSSISYYGISGESYRLGLTAEVWC